jgi:hypothetical protein
MLSLVKKFGWQGGREMSDVFAEFEMDLDALTIAMHEEYTQVYRQAQQIRHRENARPVARLVYRADAWLQRVSETVLASFA